MDVLVIGLGVSGRAAANFLLNRSYSVVAIDQRVKSIASKPEIIALLDRGLVIQATPKVHAFDLIVISPGIPPMHPTVMEARILGIEVIGEIELACRYLKQPMIAVTGTNGKTTVTQLIGHVLNACGKPARVLGNGGVPLISEIMQLKEEIVVCELSSYQMETLQSQVVDAGAILNITPDHLDRYPNMEAYAQVKMSLKECLKPSKKLFISKQVQKDFGHLIQNGKENIELLIPDIYNSSLNHDDENRLAALKLCMEVGVTPEEFDRAERGFKKPPHRIEFVRKCHGVNYFNDSKGTNLDAVHRAVEKMTGPVFLIAGGKEKGMSFRPWVQQFKGKVMAVIAIGEAKKTLSKELGYDFKVIEKDDLKSAVETASSIANEGDNVLLSPGCASFDMFKNFEERGNHFKECVWLLD